MQIVTATGASGRWLVVAFCSKRAEKARRGKHRGAMPRDLNLGRPCCNQSVVKLQSYRTSLMGAEGRRVEDGMMLSHGLSWKGVVRLTAG
jgi:hypothetical protein